MTAAATSGPAPADPATVPAADAAGVKNPAAATGAAQPPTARGRIDLRAVSIHLGHGPHRFTAVSQLSATVAAGEFVCLLGPSGCGKSTLLGAVAGHLPADGAVLVDGIPVAGPAPDRGMVFQQHSLFPWRTVEANVAFGLKMRGVPARECRARAHAFLRQVGLHDFADRYPAQLSGGMQQRAEIARVLINHPAVVLMDEPFGALDAQTRQRMQELLLDIWARVRTTILFVTHDIDEAIFLADRILVMTHRPGRIRAEIPVPFARPRRADLVTDDAFVRLKRRCLDLLRQDTPDRPGDC
jgi:NitT/TauT family transport system ATP-binding protein